MKKKIVLIGIQLVVMIGCVAIGYGAATMHRTDESKVVTEAQATVKKQTSNTIAIVNLDRGIVKNNSIYNYGTELLKSTGIDFNYESLEMARGDVESGDTGAYLIIPSDFSESVDSINGIINPITIEYNISNQIASESREETIKKINTICETMNNNLTHVYLSAILGSVYTVQDDAFTVLENDLLDLEKINQIQASDMIQIVELPELQVTENNIDQLDLSENQQRSSSLISTLGEGYDGFLARGQEDISNLASQSKNLEQDIESLKTDFQTEQENTLWDEVVIPLDEYDYDQTKSDMSALIADYDIFIANLVYEANEEINKWYNTAWTYERRLDNMSVPIDSPSVAEQNPEIINQPYLLSDDITLLSGVEINVAEETNDYFDLIIQAYAEHQTELEQLINDENVAKENLRDNYAALHQNLVSIATAETNVSTSMSEISLANYVDNELVSGISGELAANTQDIETKVGTQIQKYDEFTTLTYQNSNEYIQELQKKALEANDKTSFNIEDMVLALKESRLALNGTNSVALYSITQQLNYTRNGKTTNERLLSYVSNPVLSADKSSPETEVEEVTTELKEKQSVEPPSYLLWIVGVIIILIIIGVVLKAILGRVEREEE